MRAFCGSRPCSSGDTSANLEARSTTTSSPTTCAKRASLQRRACLRRTSACCLNARQAACELGYLTVPEFSELTGRQPRHHGTHPRFRGHFYNWYEHADARSPIDPRRRIYRGQRQPGSLALHPAHRSHAPAERKPASQESCFTASRILCSFTSLKDALPTPPAGEAPVD